MLHSEVFVISGAFSKVSPPAVQVKSEMSNNQSAAITRRQTPPAPPLLSPLPPVAVPLSSAAPSASAMMMAASTAEMMAMATMQAALASAPLLTLPQPEHAAVAAAMSSGGSAAMSGGKEGVYMCVHCGKACADHSELLAHDAVCTSGGAAGAGSSSNRISNETTPLSCDR